MSLRNVLKTRLQSAIGMPAVAQHMQRAESTNDIVRQLLGKMASQAQLGWTAERLSDWEFKVFSQWGEDGIIQALIRRIPISQPIFVEFGVESYREANTRFLLINDNWSGLVMDSDPANIAEIRRSELSWRYTLKAEQAFVTRENINELLREAGVTGAIGLLSVDIDGNDYWVWQAIEVVTPDIVIVEYNARFGPTASVTIPYRADFDRAKAHFSMIYYGASLAALCKLAHAKGLAFVGCNSAGNNAFFVRRDKLPPDLSPLTPEQGFVAGKFREARDASGRLAYMTPDEEKAILDSLAVEEV